MPRVTVLIRTKDEVSHIAQTLSMVMKQNFRDFEIVAVDSGSKDNTVEIIQKFPVKLIQINQKDFSFGYALNTGLNHSQGQYVCLLSAHAVPKDNTWLENLIEPLADKTIAATYGRQLPHPGCNPFEKESLTRWYSSEPQVHGKDPFFSTANAAIKRQLWDMVHFDEILPYAEDQKWAREIINRGFTIAYQPSAAVYHSHKENLFKVYGRSFLEAKALTKMGTLKKQSFSDFLSQWRKQVFADTSYIRSAGFSTFWILYSPLYRFAKGLGRYRGAKALHT